MASKLVILSFFLAVCGYATSAGVFSVRPLKDNQIAIEVIDSDITVRVGGPSHALTGSLQIFDEIFLAVHVRHQIIDKKTSVLDLRFSEEDTPRIADLRRQTELRIKLGGSPFYEKGKEKVALYLSQNPKPSSMMLLFFDSLLPLTGKSTQTQPKPSRPSGGTAFEDL